MLLTISTLLPVSGFLVEGIDFIDAVFNFA